VDEKKPCRLQRRQHVIDGLASRHVSIINTVAQIKAFVWCVARVVTLKLTNPHIHCKAALALTGARTS
jgi:hypothetical protein